ncbi:MAG: UDP-glucose/GDP-mannose dehydrogenase family protein [Bdellovibrionales bacterium]|nr:UDP-glucose/GDP-mannose dehydrogenase family protein [Bdellovibrionales bacterium]
MKIAVIGTGYVGLVTGACFAETGNEVTCVDIDQSKVDLLRDGKIPFFEPGLENLVRRNIESGRLTFSTEYSLAITGAELALICVGTPSAEDGSADLSYVFDAAVSIAKASDSVLIAIKSTVPVGTRDRVKKLLEDEGFSHSVISNPEFLREGSAVQDCLKPDRVVVGIQNQKHKELLQDLYAPFVRSGNPVLFMDSRSAELAKYSTNAYLAVRISFINEISQICEELGANIDDVRKALGSDQRVGMQYLYPSVGWGGSCFPKDVKALVNFSESAGLSSILPSASFSVNQRQKQRFVDKIYRHFETLGGLEGKTIAVWGGAFKANTDDIRESPALTVIDAILDKGAKVYLYDPSAMDSLAANYGSKVTFGKNMWDILADADALCVLTEWNEFKHPDFSKLKSNMKESVIFDGRNLYDVSVLDSMGFVYHRVGVSYEERSR